jgi:hypothetical protein
MLYRAILIVALLGLTACTDQKGAQRVLEEQGYTDIKTTGYSFFACSENDTFATGFEAMSPAGKSVKGTVCSAFWKGKTIRLH